MESPDAIAQLVLQVMQPLLAQQQSHQQQLLQAMAEGHRGGGGGGEEHKGRIEERLFKRVEKFSHGTANFADWAMEFKTVLATRNKKLVDVMEHAEVSEEVFQDSAEEIRKGGRPELLAEIQYEHRNSELYDVLFMMTQGEARLVVKGVENRDGVVA